MSPTRAPFWRSPVPRNQHLAPDLYAVPGQPCFATIRCTRNSTPFVETTLATIAVRSILDQRPKSRCQVLAYCVMPDHMHLLLSPVEGGSSLEYVHRVKGWIGRQVRQAGWTGKLWQPRFYDRLLRSDESIEDVAAYILANPVRKGICATIDDYPWSAIPEPYPFDEPS